MLVFFNNVIVDVSLIKTATEQVSDCDGIDYKYIAITFKDKDDSDVFPVQLESNQTIKDFWQAISDRTHQLNYEQIQYQEMKLIMKRNQSLWRRFILFWRNKRELNKVSKYFDDDLKEFKQNLG